MLDRPRQAVIIRCRGYAGFAGCGQRTDEDKKNLEIGSSDLAWSRTQLVMAAEIGLPPPRM